MKINLAITIGWVLTLTACASSDGDNGNAPEHSTGGDGSTAGGGSAGAAGSGVAGSTTASGGSTGSGAHGGNAGTTDGGDPTAAGGRSGNAGSSGVGGSSGSGGDPSSGPVDSGGATDDAAGAGGTTRIEGGADAARTRGDASADAAARPSSDGGPGTPGLGPWTTGYVATMYGNNMSGDCAGYPSFSDMTAIRTSTCSRVVTIAGFTPGVANNASFYGATGDVSSLWSGAACACNGNDTCTGTQTPSCPAEQQAGGNCGICVAVRCDAEGTFALSGSTHNQDCNATSFAVVQILDACPHNHPTNIVSIAGWCTSRQANHIDLSCSALGGISTLGMNIGRDGWLNVAVQKVDCSIGLGLHPL